MSACSGTLCWLKIVQHAKHVPYDEDQGLTLGQVVIPFCSPGNTLSIVKCFFMKFGSKTLLHCILWGA